MKLTPEQTQMIEKLKTQFLINVIDYGFYSNGTIRVKCSDQDGIFNLTIDKQGKPLNN